MFPGVSGVQWHEGIGNVSVGKRYPCFFLGVDDEFSWWCELFPSVSSPAGSLLCERDVASIDRQVKSTCDLLFLFEHAGGSAGSVGESGVT